MWCAARPRRWRQGIERQKSHGYMGVWAEADGGNWSHQTDRRQNRCHEMHSSPSSRKNTGPRKVITAKSSIPSDYH